jgi:hypothetical protein
MRKEVLFFIILGFVLTVSTFFQTSFSYIVSPAYIFIAFSLFIVNVTYNLLFIKDTQTRSKKVNDAVSRTLYICVLVSLLLFGQSLVLQYIHN